MGKQPVDQIMHHAEPPYRGVQRELKRRLRRGHWGKGEMLPSRRALAEEFQVSLPTVQKAISDLVVEGLLSVDSKKGTYATGDVDLSDISMSDAELAAPLSLISPPTSHDVLSSRTVGILADIRPGPNSSQFSSRWSFLCARESENALSLYPVKHRFFNRFLIHRGISDTDIATKSDELKIRDQLSDAILQEKPDALIAYSGIVNGEWRSIIERANQAGIFCVVVGSGDYWPDAVSVTIDEKDAGYRAASHLADIGCKTILYFATMRAGWGDERLRGAEESVRRRGLQGRFQSGMGELIEAEQLRATDPTSSNIDIAYRQAARILSRGYVPDGVIAANDEAAIGFMRAADDLGVHAGRDYAIVAFDDTPEAAVHDLTTMHWPYPAMSQEAVRSVMKHFSGMVEATTVKMSVKLVIRSSTGLYVPK